MKDYIERSFRDYRTACYGQRELSPPQEKEIEQAYLSGMHELNRMRLHCEELKRAIVARLIEIGCLERKEL
jgi:hypothetical protein